MNLISIVLVLYLIMDPVGNISSFLSQLQPFPPEERNKVIVREMFFALIAMMIFSFIGEFLFGFLQISEVTVRLSSGIILFLVSIQILFPTVKAIRQNLPKDKPFVTPLAIPLTAGPSLLATIMLFSHIEDSVSVMLSGIVIAWLLALITHLFGSRLHRLIGERGLSACERLMGMILVLLAIQRFMEGVQLFIKTYPSTLS